MTALSGTLLQGTLYGQMRFNYVNIACVKPMEGQHYLATKCLRIPFSFVVWQVNLRFVRLLFR